MEEWLSHFRATTFSSLPAAALSDTASSLATNLEEPPRSLGQEAGPLWGEILEGTHRWQKDLQIAEQVSDLNGRARGGVEEGSGWNARGLRVGEGKGEILEGTHRWQK